MDTKKRISESSTAVTVVREEVACQAYIWHAI